MTKIEKTVFKEKVRLGVPKWIRFCLTNPSWKEFTLKGITALDTETYKE